MLTANLAFLAIPGLAVPSQIIIYGSALTTITSIIISFLLLNVYSNPKLVDPKTAVCLLSYFGVGPDMLAGGGHHVWHKRQFENCLSRNCTQPARQFTNLVVSLEPLSSLQPVTFSSRIVFFFFALAYQIFVQMHLAVRITFGAVYLVIVLLVILSSKVLWFFVKGDKSGQQVRLPRDDVWHSISFS